MRTFVCEKVGKIPCEDLHNLYISPAGMWMVKSRKMMCDWHVIRTKEIRNYHKTLSANPDGKNRLEDLGEDGRHK